MKVLLKFVSFLVITTAVTVNIIEAAKYLKNKPEVLKSCHLSDSDFNKCFGKNFQVLFHEWKDGIPDYKAAGSIDPLFVKRLVITQDPQNSIAFNADLSNLVLTGASKMIVKDARFNPKTLVSQIKLFLPKFRFDCDYKLNGRILNLVLNGNGKAVFEIVDIAMILFCVCKLKKKRRQDKRSTKRNN